MDTFTLVGKIAIVIFGITTHEASHAWVANRLGDPTARHMGRITLNPLPHIDLMGTVLLPLFLVMSGTGMLFGWAKPVPTYPHNFRNPLKGMMLVAIAGPLSNLLQALFWAALLSVFLHTGVWGVDAWGAEVLYFGVVINIWLMALNLLPIPGFDGSRVVLYFLKGKAQRTFMEMERYCMPIFIGLIVFARDILGTMIGFLAYPVEDAILWITRLA